MLGVVILFWLALFVGLDVPGIILELLFLPFKILLGIGGVCGASTSWTGRFLSGRRLRQGKRGQDAPRVGADYLAWAGEGPFADDATPPLASGGRLVRCCPRNRTACSSRPSGVGQPRRPMLGPSSGGRPASAGSHAVFPRLRAGRQPDGTRSDLVDLEASEHRSAQPRAKGGDGTGLKLVAQQIFGLN